MTALDALCVRAAAAAKVVLWDGAALTLAQPPMTDAQRAALESAIARSKAVRS